MSVPDLEARMDTVAYRVDFLECLDLARHRDWIERHAGELDGE